MTLPQFYILHSTFYIYKLSFALQRFGEAAEGGGGGDGADRRKRVLACFRPFAFVQAVRVCGCVFLLCRACIRFGIFRKFRKLP